MVRRNGAPEVPVFQALRRVAQPGSALLWGSRGRGFKSRHADHYR